MFNEGKLEIDEILIYPSIGFRLSGGDAPIYNELIAFLENNENISILSLLYQGQIGFTIDVENKSEYIKIFKELNKYIYTEDNENLLEYCKNIFLYFQ